MFEDTFDGILVIVALSCIPRISERWIVSKLAKSSNVHIVCFAGQQVDNRVFVSNMFNDTKGPG